MSSLLHYFETGFLTESATHAFSWPISFKDPPVSATPVVRLTTHTGLLHWCWGSSNPYACMAGTLPTKLSLQLLFCFLFYLYMISCVCMDIHMPQHVCGGLRATSDVRPFSPCLKHSLICSYRICWQTSGDSPISASYLVQASYRFWRSEFRSSHLCDKCLTHWDVS